MDWNEVYLTLQGIYQSQEGLRRAAYLIHCSLAEKPTDINKWWPLPFDENKHQATWERTKQIYWQQKALLEKKMKHGAARA
jgi:hypothetical protein